jgi:putative PIN family toxin of toxin-antitoxin system
MPKIVCDSTVLVSAFLATDGTAARVLQAATAEVVQLALSPGIIAETRRVLLTYARIRRRYTYTDAEVHGFCRTLGTAFVLVTDLPPLAGVCRDPNDDMVVACAVAAQAQYLVTRDKDLLTLRQYAGIRMVTPHEWLQLFEQPTTADPPPSDAGGM